MNKEQFNQGLKSIKKTEAKQHVFDLLIAGKSAQEIAKIRGRSQGTVRKQISQIYKDLGITGRYETDRTSRAEDLKEKLMRYGFLEEQFSKNSDQYLGEEREETNGNECEDQINQIDASELFFDSFIGKVDDFYSLIDERKYKEAFDEVYEASEEAGNISIYYFLSLNGYFNEVIDLYDALLENWEPQNEEFESYSIALRILGDAFREISDLDNALIYFRKSLEASLEQDDEISICGCLLNIGLTYCEKRQFKDAIDHLRASLEMAQTLKKEELKSHALNNLGMAYEALENYEIAADYYQHSIRIKQDLDEEDPSSLINLGNLYRKMNRFNLSFEYLERGVEVASESGPRNLEAKGWNNLAIGLKQSGALIEAKYAMKQARTIWLDMDFESEARRAQAWLDEIRDES